MILHPFRKLIVGLNILLVGVGTHWGFEFATEAFRLGAEGSAISTVLFTIYGPIAALNAFVYKLYWNARREDA